MNINLVIQVLEFALALFKPNSTGLAKTMVDLVQAVAKHYLDLVGRPMDPSLIKPETPLLS